MKKLIAATISIFVLVFAITGCEQGTAESAGEKIDDAVTDLGNKVEDACEDVKESANADNTNC